MSGRFTETIHMSVSFVLILLKKSVMASANDKYAPDFKIFTFG